MKIIKKAVSVDQLNKLVKTEFDGIVKAVVDIKKEIMVIDGDLHADEERMLLETGCQQKDLWGINLKLKRFGKDWIEFDSMINLRPSQNNKSRGVDDPKTRKKIVKVVNNLIKK